MFLILSIILLSINCVYGNIHNVSYADLSNCKEFTASDGYNYHTFFEIDKFRGNKAIDYVVNLKFFILASKDAHILLSKEENPALKTPVYEFVIGGGSNTFAEIRRKRKSGSLGSIRRSNILSAVDVVPISITIAKNGTIELTISNENSSLISVVDKELLEVKYLSFSSWGLGKAKYFYDCHLSENEDENGDELESIRENLTEHQKLYIDLFSNYDATIVPQEILTVQTLLIINKISFDVSKSVLTTRAKLHMRWTDPKLAWNPSNYNNIQGFHVNNRNFWYVIWQPNIHYYKGKIENKDNLEWTTNVASTGEVTSESFEFVFSTWCDDKEIVRQWPFDELKCSLVFGPLQKTVSLIADSHNFVNIVFKDGDNSQWNLQNVEFYSLHDLVESTKLLLQSYDENYEEYDIKRPDLNEMHDKLNNRTAGLPIVYMFYFSRNSFFYQKIFCAPLFAAYAFIVLSLMVNGFLRAALNLAGTFVSSVMFIILAEYGPHSYVPKLIQYYQATLILSGIAFILYILNVFLQTTTIIVVKPYSGLSRIVEMKWLRIMLAMDVNTLNKEDQKNFDYDLIILFDRIVFLILFTIGVVFMSCGF